MSKLGDFYKKAGSDDALKAALKAVHEKNAEDEIAALIKLAKDFGATLERDDFDRIDDSDLAAIVGGSCSTSIDGTAHGPLSQPAPAPRPQPVKENRVAAGLKKWAIMRLKFMAHVLGG